MCPFEPEQSIPLTCECAGQGAVRSPAKFTLSELRFIQNFEGNAILLEAFEIARAKAKQ